MDLIFYCFAVEFVRYEGARLLGIFLDVCRLDIVYCFVLIDNIAFGIRMIHEPERVRNFQLCIKKLFLHSIFSKIRYY